MKKSTRRAHLNLSLLPSLGSDCLSHTRIVKHESFLAAACAEAFALFCGQAYTSTEIQIQPNSREHDQKTLAAEVGLDGFLLPAF